MCYFSAGSWENWRDDKDDFPPESIGNKMDGWVGEKWVDVTNSGLRDVVKNRIAIALSKGCHGIDPDNMDGYLHNTGFSLTKDDAKDYFRFLSTEARNNKLLIGLKNAAEIAQTSSNFVLNYADFSVAEECYYYEECDSYSVFLNSGMPVFAVEYIEYLDYDTNICLELESQNFSLIWSDLDLTEFQWCS